MSRPPRGPSRRSVLRSTLGTPLVGALSGALGPAAAPEDAPIPALTPRGGQGHRFVAYGDCCSGVPGTPMEANFQRVNRVIRRLDPAPEFVLFLGDAVWGYTPDRAELERQWRHWHDVEMAWLAEAGLPLYQCTSNHNTYDLGSEEVFRKVHAEVPRNGPAGLEGLAYFVRRDDLLIVSTHQPDRTSYRREMEIDHEWLDRVLAENADARHKLVLGHFPVFPVNGYARYLEWPMWRLRPEEGRRFWDVLVRHRVDAYLTSHVIAFDVQAHEGVLQILSGGAGTVYGPGGLMPAATEYHHAVQLALDAEGLRYQVLDADGHARERLAWPFAAPPADRWAELDPGATGAIRSAAPGRDRILVLRLRGTLEGHAGEPRGQDRTLLCGWDDTRGDATVWIGFERPSNRLVVRLALDPTRGAQEWLGPTGLAGPTFDLQVALHPGMGPGGVLCRGGETAPWSSLSTGGSRGIEGLDWPPSWSLGASQSGPTDRPLGGAVRASLTSVAIG